MEAEAAHPSCPSCGAARLRRAHAADLERSLRVLVPLRVYVCGSCHRRTWRIARDPPREHAEPTVPARPLEARDLRARNGRRLTATASIVFASILGALVAYGLLR